MFGGDVVQDCPNPDPMSDQNTPFRNTPQHVWWGCGTRLP